MLINCLANNTVLSASDSSVLATIACMDPIIHGSAVYQARAILDVDGGCETANHNMLLTSDGEDEVINTVNSDNTFNVVLFPNPNEGTFNLMGSERIIELRIFDLLGKQVYLEKSITIEEIKTNLGTGLYVIEVRSEIGSIKRIKLEIK